MPEPKSPHVADTRGERTIEETIHQAGLPVVRYPLCLAEYEREATARILEGVRLDERMSNLFLRIGGETKWIGALA